MNRIFIPRQLYDEGGEMVVTVRGVKNGTHIFHYAGGGAPIHLQASEAYMEKTRQE